MASELENKVIDVVRAKDEEALELKEKHRLLIAQLEEVRSQHFVTKNFFSFWCKVACFNLK